MIDEELTNDDEDKMGKEEQCGGKAIHARYGIRIQAMAEKEVRQLMEENSGESVVYDGKIMTPRSNNCRIIPLSASQTGWWEEEKEEGSAEAEQGGNNKLLRVMHCKTCSWTLMKEDDDKGNSVFRTLMQLNDENGTRSPEQHDTNEVWSTEELCWMHHSYHISYFCRA